MLFDEMMLALSFGALISTDLLIAVKMFRQRKLFLASFEIILHIILTVIIIIFMRDLYEYEMNDNALWKLFEGIIYPIIPIAVFAYSILTLYREYLMRISSINASSVIEAVEKIDCGLLFTDIDGIPVLVNENMKALSREIFAHDYTNVPKFYERIEACADLGIASRIDFTGDPTFILKNNEVWSFERKLLDDKSRKYYEVIAQNVTAIYRQGEDLKIKNAELEEVEYRLSGIYKNLAEVRQQKELLSYKLAIHDELGNSILKGNRILGMDTVSDEDKENFVKSWKETLLSLRSNVHQGGKTGENLYEDIVKTAKDLGVRLIIKGDRPMHSEVLSLAIREAVYNAIKHAGADIVIVEGVLEDGFYRFDISDNGCRSPKNFTEGGGLTNIRRTLESIGGSLKVSVNEHVVLHITIPKGRNR